MEKNILSKFEYFPYNYYAKSTSIIHPPTVKSSDSISENLWQVLPPDGATLPPTFCLVLTSKSAAVSSEAMMKETSWDGKDSTRLRWDDNKGKEDVVVPTQALF